MGPQGPAGAACPSAPERIVIGELSVEGVTTSPVAIYAFSFDAKQSGSGGGGGGGGAGKVTLSDVVIQKNSDASSPLLFKAAALGQFLKTADVLLYEPGTTTPQSSYELTELLVTEISNGAAENSSVPVETVAINFAKIKYTSGGVSFCFDSKTNTSC